MLAAIIDQGNPLAAKEIASMVKLPNSKIYPTLISLEKKGLIQRNKHTRPNMFFINDPFLLIKLFENRIQQEMKIKLSHIKKIQKIITKNWNPYDEQQGTIAYIYHQNEIPREILRIQKKTKSKIMYVLSKQFSPYFKYLIPDQLNVKQINAIVPMEPNTMKLIRNIQKLPNAKVKQSVWMGNSYILSDNEVMLNITPKPDGDIAILTNDPLWVEKTRSCWNNPKCCLKMGNC